jgi:CRP-like cAMP-binding protein
LRIHAFFESEWQSMSDARAIDAATRRLAQALDGLAAAVERRREADRDEEKLMAQLHALGADRSRLASDLDHATAHSRQVETTNREIARRLDVAIESIRSVIEAHDR